MLTLALLWVILVTAEGFGYARLPLKRSTTRNLYIGLVLFLLLVSTGLKLWASWEAWAVFCVLSAYRVFNLARFWYARLPEERLRSASLRAHAWLVTTQALVLAVGSTVAYFHLTHQLLYVTVGLQLLVAVLLLRSTGQTWQHAAAPTDLKPMTDKELPSVSVLVPARNETDALEACLQRLTSSDYPKLEILVLDDCSVTRQTPDIIRQYAQSGVRFVQGQVPDETHWLAKNFAYEQLVHEASGDMLLFCGVDTRLEPQTIRRLVGALEIRKKNMLSVLPLRIHHVGDRSSLFQAMRYYWELCPPRRFFKRPPVLSTCWLIRTESLKKMGGFESVSHSINPESAFARQAVTTDSYGFIRSDDDLGVYSDKPSSEQYETSVRVRYPQLHRRLELVALATLLEALFLLGPLVGLLLSGRLARPAEYAAVWSVSLFCLLITYGFATVGTRLTNPWYGWLLLPIAVVFDLVVMHISLWKYEFGEVEWKGRNVCMPVMRLEPRDAPRK